MVVSAVKADRVWIKVLQGIPFWYSNSSYHISKSCTVRVIIIETLSVGAYQAWRQNIYQLAPNLPMLSDKSRPLYVVVCCSGQLHMNCARIRSGR